MNFSLSPAYYSPILFSPMYPTSMQQIPAIPPMASTFGEMAGTKNPSQLYREMLLEKLAKNGEGNSKA